MLAGHSIIRDDLRARKRGNMIFMKRGREEASLGADDYFESRSKKITRSNKASENSEACESNANEAKGKTISPTV